MTGVVNTEAGAAVDESPASSVGDAVGKAEVVDATAKTRIGSVAIISLANSKEGLLRRSHMFVWTDVISRFIYTRACYGAAY